MPSTKEKSYAMSSYYTIIGKSVKCPQYNRNVVLSAKYRFTDNPENEYEVKFSYATCPIVENSKLHKDEQREDYKYLNCFNPHCQHLDDFPQIWDSRKHL